MLLLKTDFDWLKLKFEAIDLIDMQSQPDGQYKLIINYPDNVRPEPPIADHTYTRCCKLGTRHISDLWCDPKIILLSHLLCKKKYFLCNSKC